MATNLLRSGARFLTTRFLTGCFVAAPLVAPLAALAQNGHEALKLDA